MLYEHWHATRMLTYQISAIRWLGSISEKERGEYLLWGGKKKSKTVLGSFFVFLSEIGSGTPLIPTATQCTAALKLTPQISISQLQSFLFPIFGFFLQSGHLSLSLSRLLSCKSGRKGKQNLLSSSLPPSYCHTPWEKQLLTTFFFFLAKMGRKRSFGNLVHRIMYCSVSTTFISGSYFFPAFLNIFTGKKSKSYGKSKKFLEGLKEDENARRGSCETATPNLSQ